MSGAPTTALANGLSNRRVRDLLSVTTMCRTRPLSSFAHDCAWAVRSQPGQTTRNAVTRITGAIAPPSSVMNCIRSLSLLISPFSGGGRRVNDLRTGGLLLYGRHIGGLPASIGTPHTVFDAALNRTSALEAEDGHRRRSCRSLRAPCGLCLGEPSCRPSRPPP